MDGQLSCVVDNLMSLPPLPTTASSARGPPAVPFLKPGGVVRAWGYATPAVTTEVPPDSPLFRDTVTVVLRSGKGSCA